MTNASGQGVRLAKDTRALGYAVAAPESAVAVGDRQRPLDRVRLALDGEHARRDLALDEARQFDSETTDRIDHAIARADFVSASPPDLGAFSPDPKQIDAEIDRRLPRTGGRASARCRLHDALARVHETNGADAKR